MAVISSNTTGNQVLSGGVVSNSMVPASIPPGSGVVASTQTAQPVTSPVQIIGLVPVFPCCVGLPECTYKDVVIISIKEGTSAWKFIIGGTTYGNFAINMTSTAATVQTQVNSILLGSGITATVTSTPGITFTITLTTTVSAYAGVSVTYQEVSGTGTGISPRESTFTCYTGTTTAVDAQARIILDFQFSTCGAAVEFVLYVGGVATPTITWAYPVTSLTIAQIQSDMVAVMAPFGITVASCTLTGGSFAANTAQITIWFNAPPGTGASYNGHSIFLQHVEPYVCTYGSVVNNFFGGQDGVAIPPVIGPASSNCACECRYGKYAADHIPDDRDYVLPVFASMDCTDSYHNDTNAFAFQYTGNYNAVTSGDFTLDKLVNGVYQQVTVLNGNTYGTPGYAFCSITNTSFCAFQIKWAAVLAAFGEGVYQFNVNGVAAEKPYCFYSPPFCLKTWECYAVDGTIKWEASYNGGTFGSVTDQGTSWSLCCKTSAANGTTTTPLPWNDSIRMYGFFGYETAEYQRDFIKYATGVINKVRDEAIKSFMVKTDRLPMWMHQRFYAYGLMADQLYVTDYNINNASYNYKHFWVVADSNYSPVYTNYSRYMKILDLKFKEGDQFVFRDRCC